MKQLKYLLLILSILILASGCSTQKDVGTAKEGEESTQDPKVLLMQIKQLDRELELSRNEIAELQKQISEQQKQIAFDIAFTKEMYTLRNELDLMAHTFFSAIRFDEVDRVTDLLSESTLITGTELITAIPQKSMVYDLSWMQNMQSNLDSIRQRAYYLTEGELVYVSIYEFIPRPDEQGESQIGIVHVEFKKENGEWKIFHLYNDI